MARPRAIKLTKRTKRGTLIKLFAQAGSVVLERRRTAINKKTGLVKTSGRMDTSHTFCSSIAAAKVQYENKVAQARAEGFVEESTAKPKTKTPKARKVPSARRRTKRA